MYHITDAGRYKDEKNDLEEHGTDTFYWEGVKNEVEHLQSTKKK